jgi:hypothetical protein
MKHGRCGSLLIQARGEGTCVRNEQYRKWLDCTGSFARQHFMAFLSTQWRRMHHLKLHAILRASYIYFGECCTYSVQTRPCDMLCPITRQADAVALASGTPLVAVAHVHLRNTHITDFNCFAMAKPHPHHITSLSFHIQPWLLYRFVCSAVRPRLGADIRDRSLNPR